MNADKVIITNIQRMCMNDGPGIRTTIFFKGCNLKCPWCCNPENISFEKEQYKRSDGELGIYGKEYSIDQLYEELIKDKSFFDYSNGGITFSGGEPVLHLYKVKKLLEKLKKENIHMAVETALHVPKKRLEQIVDYIDFFMVDIKILEANKCADIIGGNLDLYYENLVLLKENEKKILFRIPCNEEYTVTKSNLEMIIELLKKYPDIEVELFATHNLGADKRKSLGFEQQKIEKLSDTKLEEIKKDLMKTTFSNIIINKI